MGSPDRRGRTGRFEKRGQSAGQPAFVDPHSPSRARPSSIFGHRSHSRVSLKETSDRGWRYPASALPIADLARAAGADVPSGRSSSFRSTAPTRRRPLQVRPVRDGREAPDLGGPRAVAGGLVVSLRRGRPTRLHRPAPDGAHARCARQAPRGLEPAGQPGWVRPSDGPSGSLTTRLAILDPLRPRLRLASSALKSSSGPATRARSRATAPSSPA